MEIIHLILGKANPERMNGVNKVVHQLASYQAASHRNVSVWGITKDLAHNYGNRNFTTQLFQAYKNPFKIDPNLKEALLQKKGKAVIHLHGGWIPIYATLSKFLAIHHIPFVLTPHGAYNTIAMKRSTIFKKIYFQLFEKTLLSRVSKIHALGASEVEGLSKIFTNSKSLLLPYGFELKVAKNKAHALPSEFIIGFVGRLDIYTKGLDLLIEAFTNFQMKAPDARLWIVGDSQEMPNLKALIAQHAIGNKVVLWGSKYGDEKDDLVQQMTIFAHPSRNEGLPVAVLEACCMQVPAIVSVATNIGNYITAYKSGIVVPNEDSLALEIAFLKLYTIWKYTDLGAFKTNSETMVREAFNWNHIINKFDKLYAS